eukprot:Em0013g390a
MGTFVSLLGVSTSNVSHTAQEIVSILNEVGMKYTLDDRLDARATDNGANFVAAVEELMENGICEEHVRCACHTLQLSIKNHTDPPKPKNAPAPTNATSELIATFRKLVNKIHASPLLTENLRTAQSGGPAAELIVETQDQEDDVNEAEAEGATYAAAANTINHHLHGSPRGHTLKLIQDVVTWWNSTYYMLSLCVHLKLPLYKLVDELGLEGPSENDWSTAELLCHFMKPFQTIMDYLQAIVDPRHKSLEWLKCHQQHTIPKQLLKEMFAGVPVDENPPANEDKRATC